MNHSHTTVSLGFTDERFPAGTHICQIYSDDAEREESLMKFVLSGLQAEECTACFSDKTGTDTLAAFLSENGISYETCEKAGLISVSKFRDAFVEDGRFDPERSLNQMTEFHENSVAIGAPAARAIGDVSPAINDIPGGERWFEFEARISLLVEKHPVTAVASMMSTVSTARPSWTSLSFTR